MGIQMSRHGRFGLAVLAAVALSPATAQASTFSYTGGEQTYTVPAAVRSLWVTAIGAQGGGPTGCCLLAGRGAVVSGIVGVRPRQDLYVEVGGSGGLSAGGFNGGGDSPIRNGLSVYGGGGASDVRTLPMGPGASSLNSRLIVAAGGGGSAFPAAAGGDAGAPGGSSPDSSVGGGAGTLAAGGAGGCDALNTGCGVDGSLGNGGDGGSSGEAAQTREGAGGGGGLYGGGGGGGVLDGAVGGGGGGSSLVPVGGLLSLAPLGTPASVEITAVTSAGGNDRPVNGSATGTVTNTAAGGTVETAGLLTQLGPFTASEPYELTFSGASYDLSGTATLVAANGDDLFGSVSGVGAITNFAPLQASGTNVVTITGGTGRFTNATGTITEVYSVTGSAITTTIQGYLGT